MHNLSAGVILITINGVGEGLPNFVIYRVEETGLVLEDLGFSGIHDIARLWDGTLYGEFRGHLGQVWASRTSCMTRALC